MKKILCMIMALVMVLSIGSAFAEGSSVEERGAAGFDLHLTVPEGYVLHTEYDPADELGLDILVLIPDDKTKPVMTLTVAFDEAYAGKSLADLNEEEKALMAQSDMVNPEIRNEKTKYGSEVIVLDENSDKDEYVLFVSLYEGYFVELMMLKEDGSQITEEEIQKGLDVLSEVWFNQ